MSAPGGGKSRRQGSKAKSQVVEFECCCCLFDPVRRHCIDLLVLVMEQGRQRPTPGNDPVIAAIEPALKVGAACGAAGFVFGGASGIVRGLPPALSGGVSALQTFGLGTIFSAFRTTFVHAWTPEGQPPTSGTLVKSSAAAGAIAGGVVGLVARGRSNALPGAIMFSLFGAGGQYIRSRWTAPRAVQTGPNFWKRMSEKSWTPFKVLTNDEYAEMLREKMLRMDVEIAVLDDKITALKEQQLEEEKDAVSNPDATNKP